MNPVSAASLLAVQAYATQTTGPVRPAGSPPRGPDGRAGNSAAFSVELSKAASEALKVEGAAEFQPFHSAADMGAKPAPASVNDFRREAPLRAAEPQNRYQRPGSQLDIKV